MAAKDEFISRVQARLRAIERDDANLQAQEEGVRRRRAALHEQMTELRASLSVYRDLMGIGEDGQAGPGLFDVAAAGTVADVAVALIGQAAAGEMAVAQLVDELNKAGKLKAPSARGKYATVFKTLSRNPRFIRTKPGVFAVRSSANGTEPQQP